MSRPAKPSPVAAIIEKAVSEASERIYAIIRKATQNAAAKMPAKKPAPRLAPKPGPKRVSKARARSASRPELTHWVADHQARRVPTFVIEETGLDTKKKIVERFGENASFRKGQPLPPTVRLAPAKQEKRRRVQLPKRHPVSVTHDIDTQLVTPKGPIIRKAAEVAEKMEAARQKPLFL